MENWKNINDPERWISVIAGSALAAYGLKKRSIGGFILAAVGGALVWRGTTGHCMLYESFGITSREEDEDNQVSVRTAKAFASKSP